MSAVAELRLEPRGLGRHDPAGVGDPHEVFDLHRKEGEGDRRSSTVDSGLESVGPARPAHEVDARVGPDVSDAEDRLQHLLLEKADVERRTFRARRRRQTDSIPASVEVHRDVAFAGRRGRSVRRDRQLTSEQREEFRGRSSSEILYDAVVRKDADLSGRKGDPEKEIPGFGSAGTVRPRPELFPGPGRARRAVVAVRDVEKGNAAEFFDEAPPRVRVGAPESVRHAVRRREVVQRRPGGRFADE